MMKKPIRILSYNMLKGRSLIRKTNIVPKMIELVKELDPDILVLQEAPETILSVEKGENPFDSFLPHYFLGMNARTKKGEHGNAIFSRYEIKAPSNIDLSQVRFAKRGLLYCQIQPPGFKEELKIFCTHLDLLQKARDSQIEFICDLIDESTHPKSPVILCGDFNDWNKKLDVKIQKRLLGSSFDQKSTLLKTYPSIRPLLPLDRIYLRNLSLKHIEVPGGKEWSKLSDHRPILADFTI